MKIETWSQYQAAAQSTAQYPHESRWDYLSLGLISEVGELAGKLKREIRDGAPRDVDALVLELGDVAWYVAQLASEMGVKLDAECKPPTEPPSRRVSLRFAALQLALVAANGCDEDWSKLESITAVVLELRHVSAALNVPLSEVLERNVAKLQSRATRGVIQGAGDHR